jgi:hypothetical protein
MIIIRSNKIAELILSRFKFDETAIAKYNLFKSQSSNPKAKINLCVHPCTQLLRQLMFAKNLNAKEIATMILNENNPKTMDYYFMHLLGVHIDNAYISWAGDLHGHIRSSKKRITESFGVLGRVNPKNYEKGQIYFTLDIHDNQIFPKSRSFRICSKRLLPVTLPNPRKGQVRHINYSSGYTAAYPEKDIIEAPKHITLYCRNTWERKGEVKPSRAKNNEEYAAAPDAITKAVSVI